MSKQPLNPTKEKLHEIIFESDTKEGKRFNIVLTVLIILSIVVVMLESVESINNRYGRLFHALEWIFTILFTIEYVLRLYTVYRPMKYALSLFGIIDLLAILPTYVGFFLIPNAYALSAVRALRIMRVFRIFKLAQISKAGDIVLTAYRQSKPKIVVTLIFILLVAVIMGSVMYTIEGGPGTKFNSIPTSVYWAIVTITTVGYGDISPVTPFGQFIAATIMIIGYVIIAVGVVSTDTVVEGDDELNFNNQNCRYCAQDGHADDAVYCKYCGEMLREEEEDDEE